jgi:hypothetical protein
MKRGAIVLAGLASVMALAFVFAMPVSSTVLSDQGVIVTRSVDPLLLGYVVAQAVAGIIAAVAAVLLVRNRLGPARASLAVAGLLGLFPAVLPGMCALAALAVLRRLRPPAPS